ncbi:hypothetical protein ABZ917_13285 [Nonomuraea wenchangensis]
MSSTSAGGQSSPAELVKPIRYVPPIPDPEAHRALRAALKKQGISDRAAGAISTIWTDPVAVLAQVENPQRRRIPGAYLRIVSGQVYTARLAPDPYNPRNADRIQFALAQPVGAPPATLALAAEEGVGEMGIRVLSRETLAEQLDWAIDTTRSRNSPHPNIEEQGIMDPPIGVATTVFYEDGTTPTTHIFVREGSSRTSHALYYMGLSTEEVLFDLPRAAAPMQSHITKINSYADKPAEEITGSEKAAVRCATTDFELIIGVDPDIPGSVDLSQAIKARVAQDHLNPKKQWTNEARHASLAEECLITAHAAQVVSADEMEWLGGRLTRTEASARKLLPYGDDRAVRTVYLFTTNEPKTHNAIRQPIALILTDDQDGPAQRRRVKVTGNTKLPLAIELIARELHGAVSDTRVADFRKTLKDALPRDLSTRPWRPTKRTPQSLFEAATEELANGEIGPAGTELWVRAAYVLAKYGMISGPRHDTGPGGDRRTPAIVMETLLESDAGLQHLRQVLEDDREGRKPRQVDSQGQPRKNAAGEDLLIDNAFLRETLAPKEGEPPAPLPPEEEVSKRFKHATATVKTHLRNLESSMRDLEAITAPDGTPLIEKEGRNVAVLLRNNLRNMIDDAERWWEAALEAQAGIDGAVSATEKFDEPVIDEEPGNGEAA